MNKYNLAGAAVAAAVLVLALVAKSFGGLSPKIMLPLIAATFAALCIIDSMLYKKEKKTFVLIRAVMMGIMGVIVTVASVIVLFFEG